MRFSFFLFSLFAVAAATLLAVEKVVSLNDESNPEILVESSQVIPEIQDEEPEFEASPLEDDSSVDEDSSNEELGVNATSSNNELSIPPTALIKAEDVELFLTDHKNESPANSSDVESSGMSYSGEPYSVAAGIDKENDLKESDQEDEGTLFDVTENYSDNSTIAASETGHHNSYTHPQGYSNHNHGQRHGHHSSGYGHNQAHTHAHNHHQSHVAPLKESVVHRDPYDQFDQYDAIRTKDHDHRHMQHQHHNHHSSHNSHGHHTNQLGHGGGHHHHRHGYGHENGIGGIGYGTKNNFPYRYETHHIPECARESRLYHNLTFCLEDHYYPTETILWAIRQSGHYAQRLLSDVTYQSADNLVDGLTRAEEEKMTYAHYFGGSHKQHHLLEKYKPPYTGYTYNQDYYKDGGYICPSDIYYARPRRAMNTYGKWKVIVNLDHPPKHAHGHGHAHNAHYPQTYTQTLRLEQCIYPNSPCSYVDSHYYSRCVQKHNFVRLVAWTYHEGLHVDTFKLPIACSCHIQQPTHYYQKQHPHHHNQHHGGNAYGSPGHKPNQLLTGIHQGKANLLNTILGG